MVDIEKRREQQRLAAERRRRKNGIAQCKGVEAKCEECGAGYVRRGRNSKTCSPECSAEAARRRAREASQKRLRAKEAPKFGEPIVCAHCSIEFPRDAARVIYCPACRALQKKNALPAMRDWQNAYRKPWHAERMKVDPIYAMTIIVRGSIRDAISRMGYTKRNRTYEILGCSWEFFKGYIEAKFQDGMTWENRGEWEIDHIVPVSSASTEEEVLKLNHYKNLQPLWKWQNREKGANQKWQMPAG